MEPKWISGTELMDRWDCRVTDILECIKCGLTVYNHHREILVPSPYYRKKSDKSLALHVAVDTPENRKEWIAMYQNGEAGFIWETTLSCPFITEQESLHFYDVLMNSQYRMEDVLRIESIPESPIADNLKRLETERYNEEVERIKADLDKAELEDGAYHSIVDDLRKKLGCDEDEAQIQGCESRLDVNTRNQRIIDEARNIKRDHPEWVNSQIAKEISGNAAIKAHLEIDDLTSGTIERILRGQGIGKRGRPKEKPK